MSNLKAFIADRIFTGETWLADHAVLVENGLILDVISSALLPGTIKSEKFTGSFLAPAFIDLQIYGAYGKLLAVYPEADSLYKLIEYSNKGGAAYCLPTVATNAREVFNKSIDAVRDYWNRDGKGILGLHLEGPWINPIKRGAHAEKFIHSPSIKEVEELLNYGKGIIKMITLAPEVCDKKIIDHILANNIIISAGHSNATYAEAMEGFENGISLVTHLYNAMSPLMHRAPGFTGATMDHSSVMSSIVPDGFHVDYAAIRIAKQVMKERLFVITDAVTETQDGYYQHHLAGDKYEAGGILSGSSLTMSKAFFNLVHHAHIDQSEVLRMCSLYPARAMKLDDQLGKIEKNYKAKFVVINEVQKTTQLIS